MTNAIVGLAFSCVVIPGVYTAVAYFGASAGGEWPLSPPAKVPYFALLLALPLVVSGAVKWWDIWIHPAPKLGTTWQPMPPAQHVAKRIRNHLIFLAVVVVLQLTAGMVTDAAPQSTLTEGEQIEEAQKLKTEYMELLEQDARETNQFNRKYRTRVPQEHEPVNWAEIKDAEEKRVERRMKERDEIDVKLAALEGEMRKREMRNQAAYLAYVPTGLLAFGVLFSCLVVHMRPGYGSGEPIGR